MAMTDKDLALGVKFDFGDGVSGTLFGGPFRAYRPGTRRLVGLKMAQEIDHFCEFKVDTEDFSIPDEVQAQKGLIWALRQFKSGNDVYVGCMGGTGRTGLFFGIMAKALMDLCEDRGLPCEVADPVLYTRKNYKGHAIETQQQEAFVRGFSTAPVLHALEELVAPEIKEVEVEVETIVTREVYLTPWDVTLRFFGLNR
jgi:hypothetical protein